MKPQADHGEASYVDTGRLEGWRALITGADSGIGRAVSLAFAKEGADVAISYLSEESDARETERLVTEAGRNAVLLPGDIGDSAFCQSVARKAIDRPPKIASLSRAFQRTHEKIEDISDDEFEETLPRQCFRHVPTLQGDHPADEGRRIHYQYRLHPVI